MLRITTETKSGTVRFKLEGRLAGPWVQELDRCWRSASGKQHTNSIRVDLSAVTFIDEEGKSLLGRMYREGTELVATGCLNNCIVEGIKQSGPPKGKEA